MTQDGASRDQLSSSDWQFLTEFKNKELGTAREMLLKLFQTLLFLERKGSFDTKNIRDLYSPRNDPQIDPEMIPINSWNGTCIPSRNYHKSGAAFTFLNRV